MHDSTKLDLCGSITVVGSGNGSLIYFAGKTNGDLDTNNYQNILTDAFIGRISFNGDIQWVKQIPESSDGTTECFGLATDSNGNAYCAGHASEKISGGSSFGDKDMFIVKYKSSGTFSDVYQFGQTNYDTILYDIEVDSSEIFLELVKQQEI